MTAGITSDVLNVVNVLDGADLSEQASGQAYLSVNCKDLNCDDSVDSMTAHGNVDIVRSVRKKVQSETEQSVTYDNDKDQ